VILSGGSLKCWGYNGYGQVLHLTMFSYTFPNCIFLAFVEIIILTSLLLVQVGDGTTSDKQTPVDVSGLSIGVISVALGTVFMIFFPPQ